MIRGKSTWRIKNKSEVYLTARVQCLGNELFAYSYVYILQNSLKHFEVKVLYGTENFDCIVHKIAVSNMYDTA